MKRIKYTNTGVTPLCVTRTSDKGHHVFDDTQNGILSIYVVRVRNHSKNDSAKCKVYYDGQTRLINGSKESILCEISNVYLSYMLLISNRIELYKKLFTKMPFQHKFLDDYVGLCAILKLKKDGFNSII